MKKVISGATAVALGLAGILLVSPVANATQDTPPPTETCVPSEAWDEKVIDVPASPAIPDVEEVSHQEYQRYSYVGGPIEGAPESTPPGDDWQANTTDYEGAGHGTDPIGEAFQRDNPGKGNADWFFWTATKVVDTQAEPGSPAVEEQSHVVHHDAVVCDDDSETVDPIVCTTSGDWYTEGDDTEPTQVNDGLAFISAGDGKAVGLRTPASGNLQGWSDVSFSATGDTTEFFFRIVIAHGGDDYQSLSFPGVTTITSDSEPYQFPGQSIADIAALYPDNTILSIGFQTNTAAAEGVGATLHSLSGVCGDYTFQREREEQPAALTGTDYESAPLVCIEPLDGTATVEVYATDWTQAYVFDDEAWEWVLGEKVYGEQYYDHADAVPAEEECAPVVVTPTPTPTTPAPTPTPTPTASPSGLAATGGSSPLPLVAGGILLLLAGVAGTMVRVARRR